MSIDHYKLNEVLAASLSIVTGKTVKLMESDKTDVGESFNDLLPYAFVEPLIGSLYVPQYGGTWPQADVPYAFYSYGVDIQSSLWMASLIRSRFTDQQTYSLALPGFDVVDRRPDGGPDTPEKVANGLWCVREAFVLQVCAH